MPDFFFEDQINGPVCGLDEVGRAPLAGPVVAACVFIPADKTELPLWHKVNDSKKIARAMREKLSAAIQESCHFSIAEACPREVEEHNIVQSSFLAMHRAFKAMYENFGTDISAALIDGHIKPAAFPCPAQPIVKGDSKSVSIAAASILAKVYRDRLMAELAQEHNHYGWERNAGYPTTEHLEAIDKYGITIHHRRNFAPVRNFMEFGSVKRQMKLAI